MLPEGWKRTQLRDLVVSLDGGVSVNGEDRQIGATEKGVLRVSSVSDGVFRPEEHKAILENEVHLARISPKANRIIVSRSNTELLVGASAYIEESHPNLFLSDKLWQIEPYSEQEISIRWLAYWLGSDTVRTHLSRLGTGTSGSMKNISKDELLSLWVPVPPLKEQFRIAGLLQDWDIAISKAEQLLDNSQCQKQALMQKLLTGHRKFSFPQGQWQYLDFDEIFERITQKNSIGNNNVLTISAQHGLISQRDFFSKNVASKNLSGYTLLRRGDFSYNKSYSAGYPLGAIKPLLAYDAGVVSSLYVCFRLKSNVDADFDFFRHYFEAGLLNEEISGIAQEGARNHGLLNVSVGDFFKLRLHVPPASIQRKIAEAINVAEAEEKLFAQQLEGMKTEKRALMQQLLTGKRRVQVSIEEVCA